jgi:hypothetical protein
VTALSTPPLRATAKVLKGGDAVGIKFKILDKGKRRTWMLDKDRRI